MLYSKNLHHIALNIAHSSHLSPAAVAEIHRVYGDERYKKGEYDGAMEQFVLTIGHVRASYVIRKASDRRCGYFYETHGCRSFWMRNGYIISFITSKSCIHKALQIQIIQLSSLTPTPSLKTLLV